MTPFPENAQSISDGISLEFGYFISLPQICQRSSSIFRDVSFRYLRSEKYALRGVSFKVILGQLCIRPTNAIYSLGPRPVSSSICVVFYAIVGSNESGKSTILKLVVARIYDPTEWSILIDGQDIKTLRLVDLRRAMAILIQDYTHFPVSVRADSYTPCTSSPTRMTV